MLDAILFADGWWRARRIAHTFERENEHAAMELFGLLGAIMSSLLAFVLIQKNLSVLKETFHATANPFLSYCRITALLLAVGYAIAVRMMENPSANETDTEPCPANNTPHSG
ncbi:hypothetical protein [Massilia sp. YMA4]|uniref:hypothetical protein n=1 Tax=Massilia sp. YMA4 TaxID=1593482 RepID=UPI001583E244|nr:hypothetical protein [Massilia sp. YMA4]